MPTKSRPVGGYRVDPVRSDQTHRWIVGKVCRWPEVRVRSVDGTDAAEPPVGVHVPRKEQRRRKGSDLDHDRDADDGGRSNRGAREQEEPCEVGEKGADHAKHPQALPAAVRCEW